MKPETPLVRQDDEAARRYVERELGLHVADPFIGLLVERDQKLVGAVILNDYRPGDNIELTMHVRSAWGVGDVRDIARYCFARVRRISAHTRLNNERACRMLTALGFKREGVLREWFNGEDAALYGLLRSEQKIYAR
jgi:RimJ/RimL family protein N-acetyltransferase